MLSLVLPKIEADAQARNYGRFVISPLESGYGITLGNALRRILLSSLEGAAITSIQVRGIHHEFSTIPHVREDMTSLLLNLKQVRFKFVDDVEEAARLRLEVQGAGVVTAGDIVCPPIVEVVNPEQYLRAMQRLIDLIRSDERVAPVAAGLNEARLLLEEGATDETPPEPSA